MSQVIHQFKKVSVCENVNSTLSQNGHIVIVKYADESETFFEKVFSKNTHYNKSDESVYKEMIYKYQILEVIQSSNFIEGDTFWVHNEPAYSLNDVKQYHESGFSKSPIILQQEPNYPINDSKFILFISLSYKRNKAFSKVYHINAKEGVEAKSEILKIIRARRKNRWKFWKWK